MKFYQGEYSGLIEFSSAVAENPFGTALLELAEREYDNVDTAVLDIAETLKGEGFDADEEIVLGLMTGDILPNEDVVELLSELAIVSDEDGVDEEATERGQAKLFSAAVAAYEQASVLLDEEDEDEDEGEESIEEDEPADEVDDEDEGEEEAAFSKYVETAGALQERMDVTDELSELRDYADILLKDKCITPHAYNMLFSAKAKDDYLNFSQAVEESGYTSEQYLRCMDFALSLFDEMGPIAGTNYQFSAVVEQEVEDAPINFSGNHTNVDDEARDLLALLHGEKTTEEKTK